MSEGDGAQPHDDTDTVGAQVEFQQEFTFPTLTKREVAIVGFAAGHAHKAPFADDQVEKWGINQLWKTLPDGQFDRWFELHSLYDFYHSNPPHQEFLRNFPGPVYVRGQDYRLALEWGITTAQPFPDGPILERFRPYFTNTISWLIALAIMMHPTRLSLYGVDMAQDSILAAEYSEQRPSCEYFLGLAEGLGIDVKLPSGSDLLGATHLYGFEDSGPVLEKMTSRYQELARVKEQMQAQVTQYEQAAEQVRKQMYGLEGAQQESVYWRKNWLTPPAKDLP
jgi:hypothetical protein